MSHTQLLMYTHIRLSAIRDLYSSVDLRFIETYLQSIRDGQQRPDRHFGICYNLQQAMLSDSIDQDEATRLSYRFIEAATDTEWPINRFEGRQSKWEGVQLIARRKLMDDLLAAIEEILKQ